MIKRNSVTRTDLRNLLMWGLFKSWTQSFQIFCMRYFFLNRKFIILFQESSLVFNIWQHGPLLQWGGLSGHWLVVWNVHDVHNDLCPVCAQWTCISFQKAPWWSNLARCSSGEVRGYKIIPRSIEYSNKLKYDEVMLLGESHIWFGSLCYDGPGLFLISVPPSHAPMLGNKNWLLFENRFHPYLIGS